MASPCSVLMETDDRQEAQSILSVVAAEASRIEQKFSRYRDDNVIHSIHQATGKPVEVDDETARLIDFSRQLYELSDGKFDITSGVLRRVWRFDGSDRVPSEDAVREVLHDIGWQHVGWDGRRIRLRSGMEIDLGGIGKEYAVDRAALLAAETAAGVSCLVNFGGDLVITRPRRNLQPWLVGMEESRGPLAHSGRVLELLSGGLATSGDSRRYLIKDDVRYGHILDPRTGWPIKDAPSSVTVAAGTCVESGMLATLAMLEGLEAEAFLEEQGRKHWVSR